MRRVLMMGWLMLVPVATQAQVPDDCSVEEERVAGAATPRPPSVANERFASAATVGQAARPVAAPPPDGPRRRGSMVGYIDDAVVSSKVRIRFETGLHDRVPDRAEFFYAKCGCYRDVGATNAAFDPAAPGPRPGAANDLNFQQFFVLGEYAFTDRISAFAELPTRWIQPQSFVPGTGGGFPDHGGVGDLRAGVKVAVLTTSRQTLAAQGQVFMPTGNASNGLGTDHASLQPSLLLYQRVSDRLVVESQVGDWHPFGGSAGIPTTSTDTFAGDVFFYGIGPSYEVYRTDTMRVAPVVELVGWHVVNGFQTATASDAGGTNIVNLKFGARVAWNPESSLYVGYGHALTSSSWYDDIVRFEYRYSF